MKLTKKKKAQIQVVAVTWLHGIQAVILADRVYVAKQRTRRLTEMLARFVVGQARAASA